MATWKRWEEIFARIFGSTRRPLSGGNSKTGRDDSLHPDLFLECKTRKSHALCNLWRETKKLAQAEGRTPVIGLHEKGKQGLLIVVHQQDLPAMIKAWCEANPEELDFINQSILSKKKQCHKKKSSNRTKTRKLKIIKKASR